MTGCDHEVTVRQLLLTALGKREERMGLAILDDGGCAITCNGDLIAAYGSDPSSVDSAVEHFLELIVRDRRLHDGPASAYGGAGSAQP